MSDARLPIQTVVAVGQVWRQEDGYLCRVVAVDADFVWVRPPSGGPSMQVVPAWFDHWELVPQEGKR